MITANKWDRVKAAEDIALSDRIKVDIDMTGDTITSIVITDEDGRCLRVCKGDYSDMKVLVPATAERFKLHGTAFGAPFDLNIDSEHEAEERKAEIERCSTDAKLEITKVKVPA